MNWDEGPDVGGPCGHYRQSGRLSIYDEHVNRLVEEGKAYRCFCTPEELQEHDLAVHRGEAARRTTNPCAHMSADESEERAFKGEKYAIMFRSSSTPVQIEDIVYNRFRNAKPEAEFIIRKRDGFPTYHLANVVDDHLMNITHVIRGAEWLISTPRHVDLYNAFGWQPPQFAHVGLLVDQKRQKLSKRDLAITMDYYKDNRIIPDALLNFAVLLGWAPKDRTEGEFMTLEDMVRKFHLKFTKGDIMVTMAKLEFLREKHGAHLAEQYPQNEVKVQEFILDPLADAIHDFTSQNPAALRENLGLQPDEPILKMTTRTAAAYDPDTHRITQPEYFFSAMRFTKSLAWKPATFVSDYVWLLWEVPRSLLIRCMKDMAETYSGLTIEDVDYTPLGVMEFVQKKLVSIPEDEWRVEDLRDVIKDMDKLVTRRGKKDNIYTPIQWALIAGRNGPAVWEQMVFLGRKETMRRMDLAVEVAREFEGKP